MIKRSWLLPILAGFVAFSLFWSYFSLTDFNAYILHDAAPSAPIPELVDDSHPIVDLIHKADSEFQQLLQKETHDLASAAWTYREKRKRHPPPGFAEWHQYAVDNNAVIVEEFWDQIYHDLTPLWALSQKQMRTAVELQDDIIQVREGRVTYKSKHFWAPIWKDLVKSISKHLPDLDMALNTMDEPRLFIPWEDMESLVEIERDRRILLPPDSLSSVYSGVPRHDMKENSEGSSEDKVEWNHQGPIFDRIQVSCPPESPARSASPQTDFSHPPSLSTEFSKAYSQGGFVSNFTLSASICHQPDLQGLHGFFIEPISIKTTDKLFPFFGSSKLTINSEILIPAAMYYKYDSRFFYKGPIRSWERKSNTLFWRGLASGGRNKEDNWKGFHRHRLVSMLNGSQALLMPNNSGFIDIQDLPLEPWQLGAWQQPSERRSEAMGNWLSTFTQVGFTGLACFPEEEGNGCRYTNYLFDTLPPVSLKEQHRHKYLVDVDGNSFSGRYRDFLLSNSVPIKSTLFKEWHDSRLIPWKHFVPLDNRFLDIYGIMEFFLGYGQDNKTKQGHDNMARKIAIEGHEWAKKVLRPEDMRIYTYRLLLEYARVMDDDRDHLGWADDLIL